MLVLTILGLVVVGIAVSSVLSAANLSHRAAFSESQSVRSYYLAREGLSRAMAELSGNPNYAYEAPVVVSQGRDVGGADLGSYRISVLPSGNNTGNDLKAWVVTSTGTVETASRTIRAWVGQQSFSRFQYFSNLEMPDNYWITGNSFTGPVHTNGHFSFHGRPAFASRATSANVDESSSPPARGKPFDPRAIVYDPNQITGQDALRAATARFTDPAQFYHAYAVDYQNTGPVPTANATGFSFAGGQPSFTMPLDSTAVLAAASTRFTGNTRLVFSAANTTTGAPPSVTVVPVNSQNQATGAAQVLPISSPMVIAVQNGNAFVEGTIQGRVTLATSGSSPTTSDPYNYRNYMRTDYGTGNVFITGDTAYHDSTSDTFGVVAQSNIIVKSSTTTRRDIRLVGSLMSVQGIFMADQFHVGSYRGTMTLFGGLISYTQSLMGTFNPSTGNVVTGYKEVYVYDTRLRDTPPPSFPTTGRVTLKGMVDTGALGN